MNLTRNLPVLSAAFVAIAGLAGQPIDTPDWQAVAGGKMAFEVASIKMDKGPFRPPNFPLDTGDAFAPSNRFSADFPLLTYIHFAYKVNFSQQQREFIMAHWPRWIGSDRYAIEAKAAGSATKDQMRLMMQALLTDRFGLAVHFETHETAVFALRLVKPGKTGPNLLAHSDGPACEDQGAPAPQSRARDSSGPFPARCYVQELYRKGNQLRAGSRNTTMDELAVVLSGLGRLDRPVVDQTRLSGRIDYKMEWTEEPDSAGPVAQIRSPPRGQHSLTPCANNSASSWSRPERRSACC
jgi:bla regulator protein blaR1